MIRRLLPLLPLVAACEPAGEATLEIGGGVEVFEPMTDGQDLVLVPGTQGLQHIWTSLRARGIEPGDPAVLSDPDNPVVDLVLLVDGAQVGGFRGLPRAFRPVEGDADLFERTGDLLVLDGLPVGEAIGKTAIIEARVEDARGRVAEASVTGTLALDGGG